MESHLLAGWDNFYVIVGSAAAGLTGLTFVVIALMAEARRINPKGVRAYVTPTVVYFSSTLALSAFLAVPHQDRASLAVGLLVGGAVGLLYVVRVTVTFVRTNASVYTPVGEDWIFHVILPLLCFATLLIAGALSWVYPSRSLYLVASASLALLFIGIHNTWDIAVWIKTEGVKPPE